MKGCLKEGICWDGGSVRTLSLDLIQSAQGKPSLLVHVTRVGNFVRIGKMKEMPPYLRNLPTHIFITPVRGYAFLYASLRSLH